MNQSTITLPVFGSKSQQQQQGQQAQSNGQQHQQWDASSHHDPMDFDMLAEYLLDDGDGNEAGIAFDFGGDPSAQPGSAVVSPEQSEDGVLPPLAENRNGGAAARAQQIISQHAAANHQQQQNTNYRSHQMNPMPAPPRVARQGIQLAPAPATYAQTNAPLAPAVNVAAAAAQAQASANNNNSNNNAAKRRRVDAPPMATGSAPSANMSDPAAVAAALQGRGRKKTQAQIDRRRERNRILARRTRLRKKFFFESLQKEVMDLQRENQILKDIVKTELEDDGNALLKECDAAEKLPEAVLEACGEHSADMDKEDFNLVKCIQKSQHCFIITDPSLQDNPIVFASDDFLSLTGYTRDDVLGRNCRFLQGTETSQDKVRQISAGLKAGEDVSVTLVNYTADGSPFWNKLFVAALRDAHNNIVNYIGVLAKVSGPEQGDPEHGKVLVGVKEEADDDDDDDDLNSSDMNPASIAMAEGTVKAIEESVDAAVAAATASLG